MAKSVAKTRKSKPSVGTGQGAQSPGGQIRIRGARQNNLRGVDVDMPRGSLVAITGLSGSGKSSLAFDTLFREGQRRFLETLSGYARQFLGGLSKPDVESIEGLSPAIAVDQKSVPRGARSTVGTLTEVTDHLRVLFARAGVAHCPSCQEPVRSRTPEALGQEILRLYEGQKVMLCAPLIRDRKGSHRALFQDLQKRGFVRVRVDEEIMRLEEVPELSRYQRHRIEVVVDRMVPRTDEPARLRESLNTCLKHGEGDVMVVVGDEANLYSTERVCPNCGGDVPPLEPRLFSFNSPHGACGECDGLGTVRRPTEGALVADPTLSIREGAFAVTKAKGNGLSFPRVDWKFLEQVGEAHGFDLDTPWKDLSKKAQRVLMNGTGDERYTDVASWNGKRFKGQVEWERKFPGILGALKKAVEKGSKRKQLERYLAEDACEACVGTRLMPAARAVRISDWTFPQLLALPVSELPQTLKGLELTKRQARIARDLLLEIDRRTVFLLKVGLGYLTLERPADTLSGGEAQRIRLAAQLGAGLQGVLYVLDEPSIGLHARDHGRLLGALGDLRDGGNSVVVVEHDAATLRAADYLIDVGPGAGRHGGEIMACGSPAEVALADTPTARMLRGEVHMPAPEERRKGNGKKIVIKGARGNNLKDVTVELPLGVLLAVTGVSGSGKSSLVQGTLRPALTRKLGREAPFPLDHDGIDGWKAIDDMVAISASPIGRTTRSNPATYTKILGPIRDLFASLPESRMRGYDKSRFSFNTEGGRCEECQGGGARYVELQFLAPVTVPCEVCGGHRFQEQTLEIHFKGKSIADVLDMTVEDAREFFADHPSINKVLDLLHDVGLGYLTLGQPSTTLSGGEAQRIKLVTHLAKRPRGHVLYLLDEPTTGLHMEDVGRLVLALQRLVEKGHSVIVIEHNLELVEAADHVIDIGPEGGQEGGTVLVAGTPEDVMACKASYTGKGLKEMAAEAKGVLKPAKGKKKANKKASAKKKAPKQVLEMQDLVVTQASLHNLVGVDVRIPSQSLSVVTGPSGSGKSSLALDTIYSEGRRRFVESLSTYARQFLGNSDRPPYEKMEGLGPAVAVEARGGAGHPRSTVATTTEIHDHMRVLWARAGQALCPNHAQPLEGGDPGKLSARVIKDAAEHGAKPKGWLVVSLLPGGPDSPNAVEELTQRAESLVGKGYARVLVDGDEHKLSDPFDSVPPAAKVDLVIDRLSFAAASKGRIAEAIEGAADWSGGRFSAVLAGGPRLEYSTMGACTECGFAWATKMEPRHFSFNTLVGACQACSGLGEVIQCDPGMLVDHPEEFLMDGAIGSKLARYLVKGKGYYEMLLRTVAKRHKVPIDKKPFEALKPEHRDLLLFGKGAREEYKVVLDRSSAHTEVHEEFTSEWLGLCGQVNTWHKKSEDPGWTEVLEQVMSRRTCHTCDGERLAPGPRAVVVGKKRLPELLAMTVENSLAWIGKLRLRKAIAEAVEPVLAELTSRLGLLDRVGLGYLTLDRTARTLSGGEARRVRLSANLGSELVGVTYVLDEPTVGLHPRDVDRLTGALEELRDRGNTVIVVEHDPAVMRRADWIVDLGPGAGEHGGRLVAMGTPQEIEACQESKTGEYLRGELDWSAGDPPASGPRIAPWPALKLFGARTHNLKGVDLAVPFGQVTGICGPSGSGKSSLVLDSLVPALKGKPPEDRWDRAQGLLGGDLRISVVDASPIGRSPRSVPATYAGLMDPLRALFVRTPDARMLGFTIANFSFNSAKGRCPACEGLGSTKVEMQFLADLWLECEECDGKRYRPEILDVRYRDKSIADVLAMSVDEAREFLEHQKDLRPILDALGSVGLGYLRLGQAATTLSGGEAQRVKLAGELAHADRLGRGLVILDEPSTGLAGSDVVHLARALRGLAQKGNAVLIIEHHTDLLAMADHLIELGPEGGEAGGRVVAEGTPEELQKNKKSITGPFLAEGRSRGGAAQKKAKRKPAKAGGRA